jgi:hypothetical protein
MSPRDLIPGDPDSVEQLAARLRTFASYLGEACGRMRTVETEGWKGPAADVFRSALTNESGKYDPAARAFNGAANAVQNYADVLRQAQGQAAQALQVYGDAQRTTATWRAQTAHYNSIQKSSLAGDKTAAQALSSLSIPYSWDPGAGGVARAHAILNEARAMVDAAGRLAAGQLEAAWQGAPKQQSWLDRRIHNVSEFAKGVWDGTVGIVTGVFSVAKLTYDLTLQVYINPKGWERDVSKLAKGLLYTAENPVAFVEAITNWKEFCTDPARFAGELIPSILLGIVTAGTGPTAETVAALSNAETAASVIEDVEGSDTSSHPSNPVGDTVAGKAGKMIGKKL